MYDIHTHVIYGVDDGAKNEEMSRSLLKLAHSSGTSHIFATPHVIEENSHLAWDTILAGVTQLEKIANEEKLALKIYAGAEILMNWNLLAQLNEPKGAYCLANSRYILIELPALEIPTYADDFWYRLRLAGYVPILAHPERYQSLMQDKKRLQRWLHEGLLLQCNGGSLIGAFGKQVQENAEFLCKNDVVHFLGSDAHRVKVRNTDLTAAKNRLQELIGKEKAEVILVKNPAKVVADEDIDVKIPSRLKEKRQSLWQRIFG